MADEATSAHENEFRSRFLAQSLRQSLQAVMVQIPTKLCIFIPLLNHEPWYESRFLMIALDHAIQAGAMNHLQINFDCRFYYVLSTCTPLIPSCPDEYLPRRLNITLAITTLTIQVAAQSNQLVEKNGWRRR